MPACSNHQITSESAARIPASTAASTCIESARSLLNKTSPKLSARPLIKDRQHGLELIFKNMRPNGALAAGGGGSNAEYPYHWVRDAALVYDALIVELENKQNSLVDRQKILKQLLAYIDFSLKNQNTATVEVDAAGNILKDAHGNVIKKINLGEPKFHLDGASFDKPWGRPQNDGPASRARTLINLATFIEKFQHDEAWIAKSIDDLPKLRKQLYEAALPADSVIKNDLEFVAHHWQDSSFDLWEEVQGDHFYTRLVQLDALKKGSKIAEASNDFGAARFYKDQATLLEQSIDQFWDPQAQHFVCTRNFVHGHSEKLSGLDSSMVMAVIRSNEAVPLEDERMLSTLTHIENRFRKIYPINSDIGIAPLIGRYPEDQYYGGNPWVLITQSFGEYYLRLAKKLEKAPNIKITALNLEFFKTLPLEQKTRWHLADGVILLNTSREYADVLTALKQKGQGFYDVAQKYAPIAASESHEQLDRVSGKGVGAENLSWNAASLLKLINVIE